MHYVTSLDRLLTGWLHHSSVTGLCYVIFVLACSHTGCPKVSRGFHSLPGLTLVEARRRFLVPKWSRLLALRPGSARFEPLSGDGLLDSSVAGTSLVSRGKCRYSDSLRAGRSGDRITVRAKFSHPAHCTVGMALYPGLERPGRGINHSNPSRTEVKSRV